jgi:hypothetical protein
MGERQYVLRADVPFQGHVQSVLMPDGTVAYTDGLTPEQYAAERGFPVAIIGDDQLDALVKTYVDGLVTDPRQITEEEWWDALNVLPPCRWRTVGGVELFHISERVTHDLVSWYARVGDRYVTFNDRAGANMERLAEKAARHD